MAVSINDEDQVSRCIIYDRHFTGSVHTDEALFAFEGGRDKEGWLHESVVLRRLAPDDKQVHEIGCLIAKARNQRKGDPPRGPKRQYYMGFRTGTVKAFPVGPDFEIKLTQKTEFGFDAHTDLALRVNIEQPNERATRRSTILEDLAYAFGSPHPHVCSEDQGDEMHPFLKLGADCLTEGFADRFSSLTINQTSSIEAKS